MPLNTRSISVSIAVVCVFIISFIGWFVEIEPLVCCKRVIIGSVAAYIVTSIAVNTINQILISVLVKSQMEQQKDELNGHAG